MLLFLLNPIRFLTFQRWSLMNLFSMDCLAWRILLILETIAQKQPVRNLRLWYECFANFPCFNLQLIIPQISMIIVDVRPWYIQVAGGDGTVGWVLGCLGELNRQGRLPIPPTGVIPLGTGNDLSRSFGWVCFHMCPCSHFVSTKLVSYKSL